MTGHGDKFTRKQEQAIAALLSSRSVEEAAKSIGVSANTLLRWLEIPEFRAQYLAARREAVRQAVARLQQATGAASVVMLKLMTDPNIPAAVRLRAADCVLNHAFKESNSKTSKYVSPNWSDRLKEAKTEDERYQHHVQSPQGTFIPDWINWKSLIKPSPR